MNYLLRELFVPCKENGFRPKILETQFFLMLLGLLVGIKILSLISFWGYFGATISNQLSQNELYALTNQARVSNGVPILTVSPKLETAAQLKLADMFSNNYFAHVSPGGVQPWVWFDRASYNYRFAGENLAMSFFSSGDVLNAWLNSETHRRNLLLKDFKEIGIAVGSGIINNTQTVVVVQEFGTPLSGTSITSVVKTKSAIKPKVTPKLTSAPTPTAIVQVPKANPISLKNPLAALPQVKAAETQKRSFLENFSYFANISLNDILILLACLALVVLFLKVFVAFHVQFPGLIVRAVLLIIISFSFVWIKDQSFMSGKVKITEQAEASVSNE